MSNDPIELDQLVYNYPSFDDPFITLKLASKYEFAELEKISSSKIPARGEFYPHQIFVHRFLEHYDRLFIEHQPGTGKTCAVGGASNNLKKKYNLSKTLDYIDGYLSGKGTNIKKCIILVKNKQLAGEFIDQLIFRCSGKTEYNADELVKGKSAKEKSKIKHQLIKDFYIVKTYISFASKLIINDENDPKGYRYIYTDQELIERYSDNIFIGDEVHNLRLNISETGERKDKKEKISRRQKKTYDVIHKLFHLILRSKIVLMSGTPMVNRRSEFQDILNLLLPLDQQMSFSEEEFYNLTIEDIEPYFRGKISYVKSSNLYVNPIYKGEILDVIYDIYGKEYKSTQLLWLNYLENDIQLEDGTIIKGQTSVYRNLIKKDITKGVLIDENLDVKNSFYDKERQCLTGIFPDGTFKFEKGAQQNEYLIGVESITKKGKKSESKTFNKYRASPYLNTLLATPDILKSLSIHYHEIIRLILYGETEELINLRDNPKGYSFGREGTAYASIQYRNGVGVFYCGACMEAYGFTRFEGIGSAFYGESTSFIDPGCTPAAEDVCPPGERRIRKINLPPSIRYAIITSGTEKNINNILELFNSWENRHGDYIKMILFTPIAREAYSLSNVTQIFIVNQDWHEKNKEQAKFRGLRALSHEDLLEEKRLEAKNRGDPDYMDIKLKVDIYSFASVFEDPDDPNNPENGTSIEIKLAQYSEQKDIGIKTTFRMSKRTTIDYPLNVKPIATREDCIGQPNCDGSADCDYDTCNYRPYPNVNFDNLNIDYSSYDLLYSQPIIDIIIDKIKEIFKNNFFISLDEIYQLFSKEKYDSKVYRKKLILLAVDQMIEKRERVINRYGYKSYIYEEYGILYINDDYLRTGNSHYDTLYYNNNLISNYQRKLSVYINESQLEAQHEIIDQMFDFTAALGPEFDKLFNQLTSENKISIIEQAIYLKEIKNLENPISKYLIDKYRHEIFSIAEPTLDIQIRSNQMTTANIKGSGRRTKNIAKVISARKLEKLPTGAMLSPYQTPHAISNQGEIVHIHNLDTVFNAGSNHSNISNYYNASGKIRILKPSEQMGWRDATEYENPVYKTIIMNNRQNEKDTFDAKFSIYGIIVGKTFKIRDQTTQKREADVKKTLQNRGHVANTYSVYQLINFMYQLQIPIQIITTKTEAQMKRELIGSSKKQRINETSINELNGDKLRYFYSALKLGLKRAGYAKSIQDFMVQNNMILYA